MAALPVHIAFVAPPSHTSSRENDAQPVVAAAMRHPTQQMHFPLHHLRRNTFPLSREQWGPEEERERRLWCVLHEQGGRDLGTLVTRFFHDHTQLHIPRPPAALANANTNQTIIAQLIERSAIPVL